MVDEVLGSASRLREIQRLEGRAAQGAEAVAHAAREAGGVPTRTAKEESHTRQVFAHAHAGEDGQLLVLLEVRVLHRTTCEVACGTVLRNRTKAAVVCCGSSRKAGTRNGDKSWMGLM